MVSSAQSEWYHIRILRMAIFSISPEHLISQVRCVLECLQKSILLKRFDSAIKTKLSTLTDNQLHEYCENTTKWTVQAVCDSSHCFKETSNSTSQSTVDKPWCLQPDGRSSAGVGCHFEWPRMVLTACNGLKALWVYYKMAPCLSMPRWSHMMGPLALCPALTLQLFTRPAAGLPTLLQPRLHNTACASVVVCLCVSECV